MSQNHLRGIAVTLRVVDEALQSFRATAEGLTERGVMYEQGNDLSPSERTRIAAGVDALSSLLAEVRGSLGLPVEVRSVRTSIWAVCAVLSDYLDEVSPSRLIRYGEVPPELATYIGPRIEEMQRQLTSIAEAVGARSANGHAEEVDGA